MDPKSHAMLMYSGMARRRRVALLIESSRGYGRGLLRGIATYIRNHGRWTVFHQERTMSDDAPPWLRSWRGDGVIARIESRSLIAALRRLRVPVVDLRGMHDLPGIPLIETNDRRVTELAVEHLLDRGFHHFAFCGYGSANFSRRRLGYFVPLVRRAGRTPHVYEAPASERDTAAAEGRGLAYERRLARWIRSLPKPVAVMACNDVRGQQVINACRDLHLGVPEDVAVVGVDNDPLVCDLCDPPLSSVEPDTERIGAEAAALLDRLMDGRAAPPRKTFVDPVGLVARPSTDVSAIPDRQVASAVRFIRQHACEGIGVEDVLDPLAFSRSTLERRFAALLGRTPREEIVRVKLRHARQLLRETDFPLAEIARISGFRHAETLCAVFRRETGSTPGAYRRSTRV